MDTKRIFCYVSSFSLHYTLHPTLHHTVQNITDSQPSPTPHTHTHTHSFTIRPLHTHTSYRYDIATSAWTIDREDESNTDISMDLGSGSRIDSNSGDMDDEKQR